MYIHLVHLMWRGKHGNYTFGQNRVRSLWFICIKRPWKLLHHMSHFCSEPKLCRNIRGQNIFIHRNAYKIDFYFGDISINSTGPLLSFFSPHQICRCILVSTWLWVGYIIYVHLTCVHLASYRLEDILAMENDDVHALNRSVPIKIKRYCPHYIAEA